MFTRATVELLGSDTPNVLSGLGDQGYQDVRDAVAELFKRGQALHAQVTIFQDGERPTHLWLVSSLFGGGDNARERVGG